MFGAHARVALPASPFPISAICCQWREREHEPACKKVSGLLYFLTIAVLGVEDVQRFPSCIGERRDLLVNF